MTDEFQGAEEAAANQPCEASDADSQRCQGDHVPAVAPQRERRFQYKPGSSSRDRRECPGKAFDHKSKSQGADGEVNAGQPDEDLGDEPRHECGKDNAQRNRNKSGHAELFHDPGGVAGDRDECRLTERQHSGDPVDQVEADQGNRAESRDRRQSRGPARQPAEVGKGGRKREGGCNEETLDDHARLPPPKRIFRLCQSATRMSTPNITGSWNRAPR